MNKAENPLERVGVSVACLGLLVSLLTAALLATAWPASAQTLEVDPPVKLVVKPQGRERLRGSLTAYDGSGFAMRLFEGGVERVEWDTLAPDKVMSIQEKFLPRDDARGWFVLGAMLYPRQGGRTHAELALRRAVNADPGLAEKADRVRRGEAVDWDEAQTEAQDQAQDQTQDQAHGGDGHTHAGGEAGGPVSVGGDLQSEFWGELSEEVMASSVADLKAKMVAAQEKLNHPLRLYEEESDYFLFYTDLPPSEARRWAGLLDRMYAKLCDIFGFDSSINIFRGRGLIVIFTNESDYHRYNALANGIPGTQGSAGLCLSYPNGHAEVSMFKQRNELDFARILVHEAVHAFNHRYRSHPHLVSWINEGLAEHVSAGLVENAGFGESNYARSIDLGLRHLRDRKSLGGNTFFYASHISGWQYPVAQLLTDYMIRQSGKRYRAFINAIKDGKHWEAAMEQDYGVTVEQLVDAFGRSVRIRGLQP